MTDVAVDNSTLSELVDHDLRDAVVRRVIADDLRLVIPVVTLSECLTQANLDRAEERARMLSMLARELRENFVLGIDWHELRRLEWKNRLPSRTPALPAGVSRGIIAHLSAADFKARHVAWLPGLRTYIAKEHTLALDRSGRDELPALLPGAGPADLRNLLEPLRDIFLGSPSHFFGLVTQSARHRRRVRDNPRTFRATITLGAYLYLNATGAAFATIGYGSYHWLLRGPQPGSWVDARTAASAAYADVLLSEDGNMRAKAEFISQAFCFPVRASRLQDWLATDEESPQSATP